MVVVIALAVRLVPMLALPIGAAYDIESYEIVGGLVLNGSDVYSSPEAEDRHPYLPLQLYWSGLSRLVENQTALPFPKIVKVLPVIADAAIALVLFLILRRKSGHSAAFLGGLLYALNPVPVYVSAYHGQFDALPALFILLSFYWLEGSPFLSGGMLGLGILSKSWPALALPSLLSAMQTWPRQVRFLIACSLVPLSGMLIYGFFFQANLATVVLRAIGYNWGLGVWGYTYFLKLSAYFQPGLQGLFNWWVANARFLTLIGLGLIWAFRARKQSPQDSFLTILVSFFAITHAFSIQYMMWIVPFAILGQANRWLRWYTAAAFLYMFIAYNTLILETHITKILPWPEADLFIIIPAGLLAWAVCVAWAVERVFGQGRKPKQHPT